MTEEKFHRSAVNDFDPSHGKLHQQLSSGKLRLKSDICLSTSTKKSRSTLSIISAPLRKLESKIKHAVQRAKKEQTANGKLKLFMKIMKYIFLHRREVERHQKTKVWTPQNSYSAEVERPWWERTPKKKDYTGRDINAKHSLYILKSESDYEKRLMNDLFGCDIHALSVCSDDSESEGDDDADSALTWDTEIDVYEKYTTLPIDNI